MKKKDLKKDIKTEKKAPDVKKEVKGAPEVKKEKGKEASAKKKGSISQNVIRKGLTVVVMIFATLLIISIGLIFVVSRKIDSMAGADAQIKLSAQGGFTCEYSEAQKLYPYGDGVIKVTS